MYGIHNRWLHFEHSSCGVPKQIEGENMPFLLLWHLAIAFEDSPGLPDAFTKNEVQVASLHKFAFIIEIC